MTINWTYFADRLKEGSTWRGIVAGLTGAGVVLTPEQANAIVGFGLVLMGLIGAFTKDKK